MLPLDFISIYFFPINRIYDFQGKPFSQDTNITFGVIFVYLWAYKGALREKEHDVVFDLSHIWGVSLKSMHEKYYMWAFIFQHIISTNLANFQKHLLKQIQLSNQILIFIIALLIKFLFFDFDIHFFK